MNKRSSPWIALLCALALVLSGVEPARAQSPNRDLCSASDVFFGYFNGVQTTRQQAEDQLSWMKRLYGLQSRQGDTLRYEVMYNYTAGFEDFVETFAQRLQEHDGLVADRFELFFETVAGAGRGGWWENITRAVPDLAGLFDSLVDWVRAKAAQSLTVLGGQPPTIDNLHEHRLRIDNAVVEGRKLLLFAHSQGNLFANAAFQHAVSRTGPKSVRLVHAAPASAQVNGAHALADKDWVINGLRLVGAVAGITDVIPAYLDRPPGLNGYTDFLGHGLLEIYLNPALAPVARLTAAVEGALASMEAPAQRAAQGFFTVTLTWDGPGDVDLHVLEPGGSHVFFRNMAGASGYLDVDNVEADGPEHYYATCDASRLQAGLYAVRVANYAEANGRHATVQVASARDGVLGTRTILLDDLTGIVPSYVAFDVLVVRDPLTGRLSASLAPL